MSITKSEILTAAKARLGRNELDSIDLELKTILIELSSRIPGMAEKTSPVTITGGAMSANLPADYLQRQCLTDADGKTLLWIDSIGELLNYYQTGTVSGVPEKWTIWQNKVFVWPKPVAQTTLTLYHHYEDSNVDAITLPEVSREAQIEGVCRQVELEAGTQGMISPQTVTHSSFYEQQVAILQGRYGGIAINSGKESAQ